MPLSDKIKWEIVFLAKHRRGPQLTAYEIAKEMRCDKKTVSYWIKRYEETGGVEEESKSGRPRKTNEKEDKLLFSIQERDREATASEISRKLEKKNIEVSANTVRRRLRERGLKFLPSLVKPLLTDKH